jgi:hypothetical protein
VVADVASGIARCLCGFTDRKGDAIVEHGCVSSSMEQMTQSSTLQIAWQYVSNSAVTPQGERFNNAIRGSKGVARQ